MPWRRPGRPTLGLTGMPTRFCALSQRFEHFDVPVLPAFGCFRPSLRLHASGIWSVFQYSDMQTLSVLPRNKINPLSLLGRYTVDCSANYGPGGGSCKHGMLQCPGGDGQLGWASIVAEVRKRQPQVITSGESYGSWAEVCSVLSHTRPNSQLASNHAFLPPQNLHASCQASLLFVPSFVSRVPTNFINH